MPNWCLNDLTVQGSYEDLKAFIEANKGTPTIYPHDDEVLEPYFCFNALVPMPLEFIKGDYEVSHGITPPEKPQMISCSDIWGTKWDIYKHHYDESDFGLDEKCEEIYLGFDTAWAPPLAWLEAIVSQFPNLYIQLYYEEPGSLIAGNAYGEFGVFRLEEYSEDRCREMFDSHDEE